MAAKQARRAPNRATHRKLVRLKMLSTALGPRAVELAIDGQLTVLTGRNGAGKSAVAEVLDASFSQLVGNGSDHDVSYAETFECEIGFQQETFLYQFSTRFTASERGHPERSWTEVAHSSSGSQLWSVSNGLGKIGRKTIHLPANAGLVAMRASLTRLPQLVVLRSLARGFVRIPANLPKQSRERHSSLQMRDREPSGESISFSWRPIADQGPRLTDLVQRLLYWGEEKPDLFEHLQRVGIRIGLWKSLKHIITLGFMHMPDADKFELGGIFIDKEDLGFVSDGTLRITEILVGLIDPTIKMLFIEEPENSIHPGLLTRVMEEIATYATDKQILLSTHSATVVQRVDPKALRLVTRKGRQTSVRALKRDETSRVAAYLESEGDLGDWLFSGGAERE